MTDTTFAGLPVKSISIEGLINQRRGILDRLEQAISTLQEAKAMDRAAGLGDDFRSFERVLQDDSNYRTTTLLEDGAIEGMRKRLDARAWQHLLHESGIRTLMDATARKEWDEKIMKAEVPELTKENVTATFGALYGSRQEIFERGVIAAFKSLSWDYKTNRPFAFGKRIVVRYLRSSVSGPGSSLGWPNMRRCDELDDLIRCLHVLDGKPEPDHRQGVYSMLHHQDRKNIPVTETEYLTFRSFRNGNAHVTFRRPDLVEKMNRILARHYPAMLPADRHEEAQDFEPVKVA